MVCLSKLGNVLYERAAYYIVPRNHFEGMKTVLIHFAKLLLATDLKEILTNDLIEEIFYVYTRFLKYRYLREYSEKNLPCPITILSLSLSFQVLLTLPNDPYILFVLLRPPAWRAYTTPFYTGLLSLGNYFHISA